MRHDSTVCRRSRAARRLRCRMPELRTALHTELSPRSREHPWAARRRLAVDASPCRPFGPASGSTTEFFARDATVVAPELLNKVFVVDGCAGRIVEVEAYTSDDPASHCYRGRHATQRRDVRASRAPLRLLHATAMHHCVNIVTGGDGDGQAVLLRAIEPLDGVDVMRCAARPRAGPVADGWAGQADPGARPRPGRQRPHSPRSTTTASAPPEHPRIGPRVGISQAADWPRRYASRLLGA